MNLFFELLLYTFYVTVATVQYIGKAIYRAIFAMPKDVSDDVVVVTGAGSGLGQLMCIRFAELGSTVVGWDINESGLETTKSLISEKTGQEIHTYICDVSNPDAVYRTAKETRNDVDAPITIFINNAGIVAGKLLMEMSDSLIDKVFKVNAISHFWTTKAVLPEMISRKKGHLVFIASTAGWFGSRRMTEYCASKGADILFAEALTAELRFEGHPEIKTTTVCPYFINTGMFAGVQSSFPNLIPMQEPEPTVDRIVNAIRMEEPIVSMPRIMYMMNMMKCVLPVELYLTLVKKMGFDRLMSNFDGRAAKTD